MEKEIESLKSLIIKKAEKMGHYDSLITQRGNTLFIHFNSKIDTQTQLYFLNLVSLFTLKVKGAKKEKYSKGYIEISLPNL